MPACPACGFDASYVSPSDAAVALRSYARRYHSLLTALDPAEEALLTRRPSPTEWSAAEHASYVAGAISAAATALRRIQITNHPDVDLGTTIPVNNATAALDQLESSTHEMAEQIESIHGGEWTRSGRLPDGETTSALEVALHAVHVGAHHLKGATDAIEQARSA